MIALYKTISGALDSVQTQYSILCLVFLYCSIFLIDCAGEFRRRKKR